MTSKERVRRTHNFERADRVPIDFCACQEVYDRLMAHYGVATGLELMQRLHVDFRWARPGWIGPEMKDKQGQCSPYARQHEAYKVERIERHIVRVGREGLASVDIRIPQGEMSKQKLSAQEQLVGQVLRDEITRRVKSTTQYARR